MRHPARDRGFVFLLVLLVMVVSVIVMGVAIGRSAVQSSLSQRQAEEYRRHHEMCGARDLVLAWTQTPGQRERMLEMSRSAAPAHVAILPRGQELTVWVRDGQGTVKTSAAGALDSALAFALHDIAVRLPANRPDLERRVGPATISLFGAPDEVLRAVAEDNEQLARVLMAMHDEPTLDAGRFTTALAATGFADKTSILSQVLTFAPSMYRMDVKVRDGEAVRRYTMLVEFNAPTPVVRESRYVPGGADVDDEEAFGVRRGVASDPPGAREKGAGGR